MNRPRNLSRVSVALIAISVALFGVVGLIASWTDQSTDAERACITKTATDFYNCVIAAKHQRVQR